MAFLGWANAHCKALILLDFFHSPKKLNNNQHLPLTLSTFIIWVPPVDNNSLAHISPLWVELLSTFPPKWGAF